MLVPSRWHLRRRVNLLAPALSPVALREAPASRARSLDSRAHSLSLVIRVACPNRRVVNRQAGRALLPQLLSSPPATFR